MDPTADLLVKLPSLDKPRLRELWQNSFNRPPSPRLRRELMLPILAFRIQELSHGGLTAQTHIKLAEAIGMLSESPWRPRFRHLEHVPVEKREADTQEHQPWQKVS